MLKPQPHSLIELHHIEKHYGQTRILEDVNLSVMPGEHVALIGPNGAGKSTLFDIISGRSAATSGQIYWKGHHQDWQGLSVTERHLLGVRRSFQNSSLFAELTVLEHLQCAGLSGKASAQLLHDFSLDKHTKHTAASLSYAKRRSLDLILALGTGGELILLDEPSAGMSASETTHCLERIRAYCQGKTLIVVEHDMAVVNALAQKIAVLNAGHILAFDTPDQIRANPLVQAAYLGQDIPC